MRAREPDLASLPDKDTIPRLVLLSFDIEARQDTHGFPAPITGGETIIITCTFQSYGSSAPLVNVALVRWDTDAHGGAVPILPDDSDAATLICCRTSQELFETFRDLIVCDAWDPDIILGWNVYGFDWPFLNTEYMWCVRALVVRLFVRIFV